MKRMFFPVLGLILAVSACSGQRFTIRSHSYQASLPRVRRLRVAPVKVEGRFFNQALGNDFNRFLAFALEKKGFRLASQTEQASLPSLAVGLHINQASLGLHDRHTVVFDVAVRRGERKLVRVLAVYEAGEPLLAGDRLSAIADRIASLLQARLGS